MNTTDALTKVQAILDEIRTADRAAKDTGYTDTGELWEAIKRIRAHALAAKRALGAYHQRLRARQTALDLD